MASVRVRRSLGLLLAALLLAGVALGKSALARAESVPALRLLAVPSAETGVATLTGATRVTLNGAVTPAGTAVTYAFEYGPTDAYGQTTPEVPLGADAPKTSVKAVVTGLSPGVTYHYRVIAKSGEGTDAGRDRTFATPGDGATQRPPSASTLPATGVGGDRATLVGRVNPGGQATSVSFEWGPTATYGSVTPATDAGSGDTATPVSRELTGLKPATTYHYRLVATNAAGTFRGGHLTFRTASGVTGITLVPSGTSIAWEGSVNIDGVLSGPGVGGVRVQLLRQDFPFTSAFRPAAAVTTGPDGKYSFRLRRIFTSMRLKAQAGRSGVSSPVVSIGSQLYVRVRLKRKRAASVRLDGRVYPARTRGRVRIERLSDEAEWVLVRTVKLKKATRGRSTFQATVPRRRQVTAYRAVVEPRDGGAHVDSPSVPVDIAGRR